jgi:IS4 transposase
MQADNREISLKQLEWDGDGLPCEAGGARRVGEVEGRRQGPTECHLRSGDRNDAPAGVKPVVWRLLTNREASTLEQACDLIDWYRARWEIELFFLVLKEGCRVEQLQLGDSERLQTALALYMVIAWRINRLMRLGRALGGTCRRIWCSRPTSGRRLSS